MLGFITGFNVLMIIVWNIPRRCFYWHWKTHATAYDLVAILTFTLCVYSLRCFPLLFNCRLLLRLKSLVQRMTDCGVCLYFHNFMLSLCVFGGCLTCSGTAVKLIDLAPVASQQTNQVTSAISIPLKIPNVETDEANVQRSIDAVRLMGQQMVDRLIVWKGELWRSHLGDFTMCFVCV